MMEGKGNENLGGSWKYGVLYYTWKFFLPPQCTLFLSLPLSHLQFGYFDPQVVKSHPEVRTDLFGRDLSKVSESVSE